MRQKFLNKLLFLFIIALSFSAATGCLVSEKDESWYTIFFDDFNRADGDLGKNWNPAVSANAAFEILNNKAVYTSKAESNNDITCRYANEIPGTKFKLLSTVITGSDFEKIECAGFIFKGYPDNKKSYSLTLNKTYFAIGVTDDETNVTTWLSDSSVKLSDNTNYYLELYVDGPVYTGCIKDFGYNVLYEITATDTEFSSWSANLLFESNSSGSIIQIDNFRIQTFRKSDD